MPSNRKAPPATPAAVAAACPRKPAAAPPGAGTGEAGDVALGGAAVWKAGLAEPVDARSDSAIAGEAAVEGADQLEDVPESMKLRLDACWACSSSVMRTLAWLSARPSNSAL